MAHDLEGPVREALTLATNHLRQPTIEIRSHQYVRSHGNHGECGRAVARTLLAKGEKVRGIVRKQGAEPFKADYDDVDALMAAFTGVAGVFIMVPPNFAPAPGFPETKATLKVLHEALSRAQPSNAVYLSSIGAEQASGLGLITSSHLLAYTAVSALRKLLFSGTA